MIDVSLCDDQFVRYLESKGSIRLVNTYMAALISSSPRYYKSYSSYVHDSQNQRFKRLKVIPNFGLKTFNEFECIVESYYSFRNDSRSDSNGTRVDKINNFSLIEGDFFTYITTIATVRLINAYSLSIESGTFPYPTLEAYLFGSYESRLRKLNSLKNIGKGSSLEFEELIHKYVNFPDRPKQEGHPPAPVYNDVDSLLLTLKGNLYKVIIYRYGLYDNARETLASIGERLSITRERVRQLQIIALKTLRSEKMFWDNYFDEHSVSINNQLFDHKFAAKKLYDIGAEFQLAIDVFYGGNKQYISKNVASIDTYLINPEIDAPYFLEAYALIKKYLSSLSRIKYLHLRELSLKFDISLEYTSAVCEVIDSYSIINGYIYDGKETIRSRRLTNILYLYDHAYINSPAKLWNLKETYWSHYQNDKCSGRDLTISMEATSHFINLHELGWLRIKNDHPYIQIYIPEQSTPLTQHTHDQLYNEPLLNGGGLVNQVYRLFDQCGPMQLQHAANKFTELNPQYKQTSFYPTIVVYAMFLKLAPGVIGIQKHLKDNYIIHQARLLLLDIHHIKLFMLAKESSKHLVHYPLWDTTMEQMWCDWLLENDELNMLGNLLYCIDVKKWKLGYDSLQSWKSSKKSLAHKPFTPEIAKWGSRRVDYNTLYIVLAAASVYGYTSWMHANLAVGWRLETTRIAVALAVLVHAGALNPSDNWYELHNITDSGKELFSLLHNYRYQSEILTTTGSLIKCDNDAKLSWAANFSFDELIDKIDQHFSSVNHP